MASGTFTLPEDVHLLTGPTPYMQCIATNARGGATVQLQKAWTDAYAGDQTGLWVKDFEFMPYTNPTFGTVDNPDRRTKTSTANGDIDTWIDNMPADTTQNNVAEAQSLVASKVYLAETLDAHNRGDYLAGAPTCTATDPIGNPVPVADPVRATQADVDALNQNLGPNEAERTLGANDYVLTVPDVLGVTVVCTVANEQPRGTITIVKSVAGAGGDFTFTGDWEGITSPFTLSPATNGSASVTTVQVPTGTYKVTETDAGAAFDLTALECKDSLLDGRTSTVSGLVGIIELDDGETVTCTFTNTQKTTLVVTKDTQPNHAQPFTFTVTSPDATVPTDLANFTLVDDGATPATSTIAGQVPNSGGYVVTEAATAGWTLDPAASQCTGTDATGVWVAHPDETGAITTGRATPGGTISCTFVNKVVPAELTVEKTADGVGDDYGWQFQFTLSPTAQGTTTQTVSGVGSGTGSTTFTGLQIGQTYTLLETPLAGWEQTALGCVDATTGAALTDLDAEAVGWQFRATPAQQITCSVENAMAPNSLALVKSAHLDDLNGDGVGNLGETIHWTFNVTNNSPVPLHDVSIDDPTLAALGMTVTCPMLDTLELGILAPLETTVCTSSNYTISQADVDAGQIANVATAKATAPEPPGGGTPPEVVSPPDGTTTPTGEFPSLTLTKSAVGVRADYAWSFDFELTQIGVDDDPTQTATLSGVGPAQSAPVGFDVDFGATYNLAELPTAGWLLQSLVCTDQNGERLIDADLATEGIQFSVGALQQIDCVAINALRLGNLELEKTAHLVDRNGDGKGTVGEQISWSFLVTNTSAVVVDQITVHDPTLAGLGIAITCPATELAAGASMTCESGSYAITRADVVAGHIHNVATVTGTTPDDKTVESPPDETDTPTVSLEGSLQIAKTAILTDLNGNKRGDTGEQIRYEFKVTNTGEVQLSSIVVDDPMLRAVGVQVSCPSATLAPGASMVCKSTSSYTVTAADTVAGKVTNIATAQGRTPGDEPVVSPPSKATIFTARPILPKTGSSEGGLALIGLGLVLGAGLAATARRRRG